MQKDPVALVKNETDGRGADVVFNTTAVPAIAKQAIAFTANGGQTFMFSSMHPDDPVSIDLGAVHAHEKFIKGTVSPTRETYFRATQLISKKHSICGRCWIRRSHTRMLKARFNMLCCQKR